MLTAELIRSVAPRARQDYVDALVAGGPIFEQYGITTPLRLAAFMATVSHETGGMSIVRENLNYTTAAQLKRTWPTRFADLARAALFLRNPKKLANEVYGGRMGNEENGTDDDDGWRYRGGGLIQLTGRNSFRAAGLAIGVNLESQPELIESADVSLRAACWEFSKFVALCDKGDKGFRSVCNGINRGNALSTLNPIGWADRQVWYARWCRALAADAPAEDDVLNIGDQGALVKQLQERLAELGYANGAADGVFGSLTRGAVATFQLENGLSADGEVGPLTRAALNSATAKPLPLGDRKVATAADLREAGSSTIENTDKLKAVAKAIGAATTGVGVVKETGALESAQAWLTELTLVKATTTGLVDILVWAAGKWYIAVIILAYFLYRWAKNIEFRRVLEHRLGINLAK
jgi:putative chitinase